MLTGWLSPQGDFFPCNSYGHIHLAGELSGPLLMSAAGTKMYTPDDALLSSRWIKLFQDGLSTGRAVPGCRERTYITDSQLRWLMERQPQLSARQERCLSMELELY